MRRQSGLTLLELLAVFAIIGIIAAASMPAFATYRRNASMRSQAAELRGIFRAVRSRAIMRGAHAGVKFTRAGNTWIYSLYEDGNGNGIRSAEIASGVDRRYSGPSMLMPQFNIASIALLSTTIRDPHESFSARNWHLILKVAALVVTASSLGWMIASENWLFVAGVCALLLLIVRPIEVALGLYAFLIPFESMTTMDDSAGPTAGTVVRIEYYADTGRPRQDAPDGQSANPRKTRRDDSFLGQSEQQKLGNGKAVEKIQRAQYAM